MKLICSVLVMVLLAGQLGLDAQVDADTLARIHKALHATHSDRRLTAVPAEYLGAQQQPTFSSPNGTVADEVRTGAAYGAALPAVPLLFACLNTTEPDPNVCNKATAARYIIAGAALGALAGLVVGIWKER
jgi:hypothetical protein